MALERNTHLDRNMFRVKEELYKLLKWTSSSKILETLTHQGDNSKKDLGFMKKSLSHITQSKNVNVSDLLLCTHYGKDDHLKINCPAIKNSEECLARYFEQKKRRMEHSPRLYSKNNSKLKKVMLPLWTRKVLITPLICLLGTQIEIGS